MYQFTLGALVSSFAVSFLIRCEDPALEIICELVVVLKILANRLLVTRTYTAGLYLQLVFVQVDVVA